MHSSAALAIALLALSNFTSAACNTTGQKSSKAVRDAMMEEEQLYGVCTSLIGNYAGSERRMTCMSVGGNKYDFTLLRTENSPRSIDILECMDGMKKELDCERGGKTTYGNWQYKADYNKGTCMDQQVFYARDNAVKFQA